jgi:hypothetical protein
MSYDHYWFDLSFLFYFIMGGPGSFVKLFGPTQAIKIYLDFDIIETHLLSIGLFKQQPYYPIFWVF